MPAPKTQLKLVYLFEKYNNKYWKSNLPTIPIELKEVPGTYGEYYYPDSKQKDNPRQYKIIINARMHWREKRSIRNTLLHEMCHHAVFLKNKERFWKKKIIWHGKEWRREMERVGFKKPVTRFT